MALRALNNSLKRDLIESYVLKGAIVLDMGCGTGGDFHKWKAAGVEFLVAADPSRGSINEARKRVTFGPSSLKFVAGELEKTPELNYDFIFWNFSLQYVFDTEEHLDRTVRELTKRVRPGTVITGVIPDSHRIFMLPGNYEDPQGNQVIKGALSGAIGETVEFFVKGAPYYRHGPIAEPVAWRDLFVTKMEAAGLLLAEWRPFSLQFTGLVTDLYSVFSFVAK